jgi:SAM-dependent methyltransferase
MLPLGEPVQRCAVAPPTKTGGCDPATLLAGWLAEVQSGDDLRPRLLRLPDGRVLALPVARWAGPVDSTDELLLDRAVGPVLDVGCGPGRLTAALHQRGVDVLGLELVEQIPVLVRRAGAPLWLGDVFSELPRVGHWRSVLLADGNLGIGGDAVRLLRRLRALLSPQGQILCELHPGSEAPAGPVRLEGLGTTSSWFSWSLLGRSALPAAAAAAGLTVSESWSSQGRDFAALLPV